jgi:hypothetical protein
MALNAGNYTLTGLVNVSVGHTLAASTGFYTLTGVAISVQRNRTSTVVNGAYTLTGPAMTLVKVSNRTISLAFGSYSVIGQPIARPTVGKALACGFYVYTGEPVTFKKAKVPASLASGTYAVTGPAMTIRFGHSMSLNTGSYLTYGSSGTKIFGPGGKLGGQTRQPH